MTAPPSPDLTEAELLTHISADPDRLRRAVVVLGHLPRYAEEIVKGTMEPTPQLIRYLGYDRVTVYRKREATNG